MSEPAYLQAPGLLQHPDVQHGFFGRAGGVSSGACASLNVGTAVGDTAAHVAGNQARILAALGRSDTQWCQTQQVHGIHIVSRPADTAEQIPVADAQLSCSNKVSLAVYTADCVPILLAAPGGVATVHAGWRGSAAQIAAHALARLQQACRASPNSIRAALGPAIGPCCFAVGEEVQQQLAQVFAPAELQRINHARAGRLFVDLWAANETVLLKAGLPREHIDTLRICTHCDPSYFSYRRDAGVTGRQAAVIGLR